MNIQVPTLLLDGAVLALLSQEDMYGYVLTKSVQEKLPISESTMYPVLRRLKKDDFLETYDVPFEGRMRRYYKLTEKGQGQFEEIRSSWSAFKLNIDDILQKTEKVKEGGAGNGVEDGNE